MSSDLFSEVDAWLGHAMLGLKASRADHQFLQQQLAEIRTRIGAAEGSAPHRLGSTLAPTAALDRAVAVMRDIPRRLSPAEAIVLSKLLVLRSVLCTPRFRDVDRAAGE